MPSLQVKLQTELTKIVFLSSSVGIMLELVHNRIIDFYHLSTLCIRVPSLVLHFLFFSVPLPSCSGRRLTILFLTLTVPRVAVYYA